MSTQLTPVAWQKFGDEYNLTGQFGMRPIFLSVGLRPKPGLRLLNIERGLLVPFTPDHPHAQRIVDGWNNADRLKEFERVSALILEDVKAANYIQRSTLDQLKTLCEPTVAT